MEDERDEPQAKREELLALLFSVQQDIRLGNENHNSLAMLRVSVDKMESLLEHISW